MDKNILDLWPNCAVPNCPNKCCLALESRYCYPHTRYHPKRPSLLVAALISFAITLVASALLGWALSGLINWMVGPEPESNPLLIAPAPTNGQRVGIGISNTGPVIYMENPWYKAKP